MKNQNKYNNIPRKKKMNIETKLDKKLFRTSSTLIEHLKRNLSKNKQEK